jgi:hypothetical protein
MAAERIAAELGLLRRAYPDLEYRAEGHWVRIPSYPLPDIIWDGSDTEVCFQIPENIPAQGPYGFYVRPGLALQGGTPIDNYTYPAPTGFGNDWGKFSWQLLVWTPKEEVVAGTNMVNFARSIGDRLREGR